MILKIKFVDFWFGFAPANNYFFRLLSTKFKIELSDDPDILIFSCFGIEYLKYDCIKIFYSTENIRPDFTGCDYAITFDYNNHPRHFRLPLYALYSDQIGAIDKLLETKTRQEVLGIWRNKKKFCCMVVSNGESQKRLDFFNYLSKYKHVDSGGKVMNNIGGPVKDKMDFIKDYRFVISFENASHPGYTTEKIIEPLMAGCIPLYWGDPLIYGDFNAACFLNLDQTKSFTKFIEEIIAIDTDEEKAISMLMEPKFTNGKMPDDINKEYLHQFFEKIIISSANKIPVAKTWKKYIHLYKVRKNYYFSHVKNFVHKLYRNEIG